VERTLAWFGQFRRLVVRYERRADIHLAFLTLAAALITWRFVQRWFFRRSQLDFGHFRKWLSGAG